MDTWLGLAWSKFSIVTVITAVLLSILIAGWMAHQRTTGLEERMARAESQVVQAMNTLNTAKTQYETNQGRSEQLIKEQRLHVERDDEARAATDSELRDMRAELKMLRGSVFTMRPAAKSKSYKSRRR
jgi:multidrug efflux pump subunit AcrA (membrane-fusion protein)